MVITTADGTVTAFSLAHPKDAAIRHSWLTDAPTKRSLIAYDH